MQPNARHDGEHRGKYANVKECHATSISQYFAAKIMLFSETTAFFAEKNVYLQPQVRNQ
jgi:hypothetical protein